jgi:hypothetical protein
MDKIEKGEERMPIYKFLGGEMRSDDNKNAFHEKILF